MIVKSKNNRLVHVQPHQDATVSAPGKAGPFVASTKNQVLAANIGDRYYVENLSFECPGDKETKSKGSIYIKIIPNDTKVDPEIVLDIDKKPLFPDTDSEEESTKKLLEFIYNNVTYPKDAIQNSIEGTAIVKFVIGSDGYIHNINMTRSLGWGIDEVVLDMIDEIQQIEAPWTPAILDNKNVNYEYVLPVKFRLEDNQIDKTKSRKLNVQSLNINPNPSNGQFNLAFTIEDKTPVDIIFYSEIGMVIKSLKKVNVPFTRSIDLTDYRGQTVFMNIVQKDKIHSDKIIVQ